ncbi:MAG: hypothetical protein A3E87_10795 [Gammaproteobacteria bacterium RIFCSPHIGHO2_12_FULL_35_23]|nr:MAG: hypothetical protein A3E87_10795 [Gammaproteobacteria bacterium RIFCSPHIGHO2_12_FULL_35_23]
MFNIFSVGKKLTHYYVDVIDPQLLQIQHAFKTIIILALSVAYVLILKPQQPLWLIIVGVFVMQAFLGDSLRYRIYRLLIISFISVVGVFLFTLLNKFFWAYLLCLAMAGYITFYIRQYGLTITITSTFTLFLFILTNGKDGSLLLALERLESSSISALFAIIVALIIFPYRPKKLLFKTLDSNVVMLKKYLDGVFLDFLWGQEGNIQSLHYKNRVNTRLKQARSLLLIYPVEEFRLRFERQFILFSQIVALKNVFSNPSHSKIFFSLFQEIRGVKENIVLMFEQLGTVELNTTIAKLEHKLEEINKLAPSCEDVASFFFIVNQIINTFKKRAVGG